MKNPLKGVKGKQVLVSGLAVLVLVAGYYRWSVERNGGTMPVMNETLPAENGAESTDKAKDNSAETAAKMPAEGAESADYFAKARYERDCARSEAAELLKVSAQGGAENKENEKAAADTLAAYAKNTENEVAIENMVKAKGFSDCVAFVDETGVRVVVKSDKLEAAGVAKIKDIVVQQTGTRATDIKISCKNE